MRIALLSLIFLAGGLVVSSNSFMVSVEEFGAKLQVRMHYRIECHSSQFFTFRLRVYKKTPPAFTLVAEQQGGSIQKVVGVMSLPDKNHASAAYFEDFEVYLVSNCTADGEYHLVEPVQLTRCENRAHSCDLNVYFLLFGEKNYYVADPLIIL